jgi:hypothetical protein
MWHLAKKEFAEHGWVFLLLIPLASVGFLLALAAMSLNSAGSLLEAVPSFGTTFLILIELVLCNRLVVHEYSKKTQLFLESLSISRWTMLITKYVIGLAVSLGFAKTCLLFALLVSARQEDLGLGFVTLMSVRLSTYVFCTFSFFFMMGLLGRYRIPIYIGLALGWIMLSQFTTFETLEHGPLGLLDDRFAYERSVYPVKNLQICGAAGAVFVIIAILMGVKREGAIASMLAERMSYREKIFIATMLISMILLGNVLDDKQTPAPYSIENSISRRVQQNDSGFEIQVEISGNRRAESSRSVQAATELADTMQKDLSEIATYLEIQNPEDLFVANRTDLDGDRFEAGKMTNAGGALIRVNYMAKDWNARAFRAYATDLWLSRTTNYIAIDEPRCWVLEGFAEYWPRCGEASGDAETWDSELVVDLRAAYSSTLGFSVTDVEDWYHYRDRIGQPLARAVACAGLVLAKREYGEENLQRFLKTHPIDRIWKESMGDDYDNFKMQWQRELEKLAIRWKSRIEEIPRLEAKGHFEPQSPLSYSLVLDVRSSSTQSMQSITVKHKRIDEFDMWEDDSDCVEQTQNCETNHSITIRQKYPPGSRILWTTVTRSTKLDCDVISGWQRQEVKE